MTAITGCPPLPTVVRGPLRPKYKGPHLSLDAPAFSLRSLRVFLWELLNRYIPDFSTGFVTQSPRLKTLPAASFSACISMFTISYGLHQE